MVIEDDNNRPNRSMLEKAWDWNHDGGGLAWREDGEVVWEKGFMDKDGSFERYFKMVQDLPVPFIAHMRIATKGGVRKEFTQPFPVSKTTNLALKGRTKGFVLFHNGTWNNWDDKALEISFKKDVEIPTGKFNDSRAIAWLTSIKGLGFMELLPTQRGVAYGPNSIEIYTGDGFVRVNGILCSNDNFVHKTRSGGGNHVHQIQDNRPMCRNNFCSRRDVDTKGWCPIHIMPVLAMPGSTGVAPAQQTPFPAPTPIPLIPMETAELIHKSGNPFAPPGAILSKGVLKSIRKAYWRMEQGGNKEMAQARKSLELISLFPVFIGWQQLITPPNGAN